MNWLYISIPMPLSVRLPRVVSRCIHIFAPLGKTRRYCPCSSTSLAGPLAVSIFRTVSLLEVVPQFATRLARVCLILNVRSKESSGTDKHLFFNRIYTLTED